LALAEGKFPSRFLFCYLEKVREKTCASNFLINSKIRVNEKDAGLKIRGIADTIGCENKIKLAHRMLTIRNKVGMLISASTWFGPNALEIFAIPIAIILGTLSAWITRKVFVGPLIYIAVTVSFYLWILIQFYSSDTSAFFTVHMNDFDSYTIEIFFAGISWLLSWTAVQGRKITR
jgi:hypothetical protein